MFIDADDVVHSKMLETELKVLKEENRISLSAD